MLRSHQSNTTCCGKLKCFNQSASYGQCCLGPNDPKGCAPWWAPLQSLGTALGADHAAMLGHSPPILGNLRAGEISDHSP